MIMCKVNNPLSKKKRLAIEMLIVTRDLRNQNSELRWVDTRQMISDPLTKVKADCSFLRFVLKRKQNDCC